MPQYASLEMVRDALPAGTLNKSIPFADRYQQAVADPAIRDLMEFETPAVHDLSEIVGIERGKVYAVRYDLTPGVDNHKKEVVGGLILRGVLQGKLPREGIDTLIDAGNVNSAMALKYYTEKFGMNGMYVMSRLFPPSIVALLESNHFHIEQAPEKYDNAREREFYEYMISQMANRDFRKNKYCLLHARDGGAVTYPFGREVAAELEETPTHVLSCLGAGSTLQGLQLAVQDYFSSEKIKVLVGEHELSPLFAKIKPVHKYSSLDLDEQIDTVYATVNNLPHSAIGPHYDEINQLLSKDAIERIDGIVQYSEDDWQQMQHRLKRQGISVGNTSAANLSAAARVANEGNAVLTTIFEPFRPFYENNWDVPWLFRENTLLQKTALRAAAAIWVAAATAYTMNADSNWPTIPPM